MKVAPVAGTIQCPECGTPVETLESLRLNAAASGVVVCSEPCGHEWEYEVP